MKIATLGIITRKDPATRKNQVLLGLKRGDPEIGEGTLNGPGGKKELGETILECLLREVEEEVGLIPHPEMVEKVAVITFYAGGKPSFEVHVYRTSSFIGEPHATESMIPSWYDIDEIPFNRMLESDQYWFPLLLSEKKFNAEVYYREKAKGFLGIKIFPFVDHE